MADKGLEAVGLISRANDVYHAGDSRRAFQLLDDAIAKLPRDDVESAGGHARAEGKLAP